MDDSGDAGVQEETEASGRSERCESCAKALRLLYAYTQVQLLLHTRRQLHESSARCPREPTRARG